LFIRLDREKLPPAKLQKILFYSETPISCLLHRISLIPTYRKQETEHRVALFIRLDREKLPPAELPKILFYSETPVS